MKKFIKNPGNPIYGGPKTGTLFDVYVTRSDDRFRMDFSWRPKEALAVAFSDDGIHWSDPEITLQNDFSTGWEDSINRNCVLKIGDEWRMWYTGQARGYSFIGAAASQDGIHFERIGSDPILVSERHFEGLSVMNPCVLYENGVYRMWYAAGETIEPNVLALAESTDGINWIKDPINPIFTPNKTKEYESDRVGGCQVIHTKLGYLMFYIGYRDIGTACICAALSENGRTGWRRCKLNPLVTPDVGEWDEDSCYKPSALFDGKGWHIWYNGRRGNKEYIGEAYMDADFSDEDFEPAR